MNPWVRTIRSRGDQPDVLGADLGIGEQRAEVGARLLWKQVSPFGEHVEAIEGEGIRIEGVHTVVVFDEGDDDIVAD
jgi:hypothetical protein